MTEVDWSLGTFEGSARATARAVAAASPQERMDWLDEALALAEASGALARVRAERQRAVDETWANSAD